MIVVQCYSEIGPLSSITMSVHVVCGPLQLKFCHLFVGDGNDPGPED